jgi:hypothetical protein
MAPYDEYRLRKPQFAALPSERSFWAYLLAACAEMHLKRGGGAQACLVRRGPHAVEADQRRARLRPHHRLAALAAGADQDRRAAECVNDSRVLQHFFLRHLQQDRAIRRAGWGECAEGHALTFAFRVDACGGFRDPGQSPERKPAKRRCGSGRVRGRGLARGRCPPHAQGKRSPKPVRRQFFRGKRPPGGPEANRQAIVFRFLSGPKSMLGGEARNIASDRANFLGSHPA